MWSTGRWIKSQQNKNYNSYESQISRVFSRNLMVLCGLLSFCALLFFVPSYYFIQQNYKMLTELAFDLNPTVVSHLERESNWILGFLFLSLTAFCSVAYFLVKKFFVQMLSPLIQVEKHMRQISKGYWNEPLMPLNPEHDLQSFYSTYDYLHRTLKTSAEYEMNLIEKMIVDQNHREAVAARRYLLELKRKRLGVEHDFEQVSQSAQVVNMNSRLEKNELKKLVPVKKVS